MCPTFLSSGIRQDVRPPTSDQQRVNPCYRRRRSCVRRVANRCKDSAYLVTMLLSPSVPVSHLLSSVIELARELVVFREDLKCRAFYFDQHKMVTTRLGPHKCKIDDEVGTKTQLRN